jgi:hypothetical protein
MGRGGSSVTLHPILTMKQAAAGRLPPSALPKAKTPRSASLHHFCQCSIPMSSGGNRIILQTQPQSQRRPDVLLQPDMLFFMIGSIRF